MSIITDNIEYSRSIFGEDLDFTNTGELNFDNEIRELSENIFNAPDIYLSETGSSFWNHIFIVKEASRSQYDILIESLRNNWLQSKNILCLAGSGKKFHGFRDRTWMSLPGNIHLSVLLSPGQPVDGFGPGFLALAAISALQTIENIDSLENKAGIKWVNDILIDKAKVCGVLAHTQAQGDIITGAVLGIGLNVESIPGHVPDSYIPKADCINSFLDQKEKVKHQDLTKILVDILEKNYKLLIDGGWKGLINIYKKRSISVNKNVVIMSDPREGPPKTLYEGIVEGIGDTLELYIEGVEEAIINGRMILK